MMGRGPTPSSLSVRVIRGAGAIPSVSTSTAALSSTMVRRTCNPSRRWEPSPPARPANCRPSAILRPPPPRSLSPTFPVLSAVSSVSPTTSASLASMSRLRCRSSASSPARSVARRSPAPAPPPMVRASSTAASSLPGSSTGPPTASWVTTRPRFPGRASSL